MIIVKKCVDGKSENMVPMKPEHLSDAQRHAIEKWSSACWHFAKTLTKQVKTKVVAEWDDYVFKASPGKTAESRSRRMEDKYFPAFTSWSEACKECEEVIGADKLNVY